MSNFPLVATCSDAMNDTVTRVNRMYEPITPIGKPMAGARIDVALRV